MSYCRWSSNNFECDIYAYESKFGYEIHIKNGKSFHCETLNKFHRTMNDLRKKGFNIPEATMDMIKQEVLSQ